MLQQRLPGIKSTESGEQAEAAAATAAKGFIDQYFGKWHVWSFHAFNKEATFKFGGIIIFFITGVRYINLLSHVNSIGMKKIILIPRFLLSRGLI